jgi:hypothetical protein
VVSTMVDERGRPPPAPPAAAARAAGLRGARPSVPPDANGVDASGAQPAVRALMET